MLRGLIALCAVTLYVAMPRVAVSHEIEPVIANLQIEEGQSQLQLRLSAEAVLAGVDLSSYSDTSLAPQDEAYDALRALSPEELSQRVIDSQSEAFANLSLGQDFTVTSVTVEPQDNPELARDTVVTFSFKADDPLTLAWPSRLGDVVLRILDEAGTVTDARYIEANDGQVDLSSLVPMSAMAAFVSYIPVGFDHIIPKGLDHILFVIGLFLLSFRWRDLLWQISAFTVAHTVTLALTSLGVIALSGAIVEPLIAASIAYVAFENIWARGLGRGRVALIFGFGLLHGMGFASVLGDFGLPAGQFIPSLIGFNVGVEIGQLAVVALCWVLLALPFGQKPWYRSVVTIPLSVIIGMIGVYWVIERTIL